MHVHSAAHKPLPHTGTEIPSYSRFSDMNPSDFSSPEQVMATRAFAGRERNSMQLNPVTFPAG